MVSASILGSRILTTYVQLCQLNSKIVSAICQKYDFTVRAFILYFVCEIWDPYGRGDCFFLNLYLTWRFCINQSCISEYRCDYLSDSRYLVISIFIKKEDNFVLYKMHFFTVHRKIFSSWCEKGLLEFY